MNYSERKNKRNSGLTLIEAIVYVAIFTVVMSVILQSVISFYQTNRYTLEQMNQLDIARKGVSTLVVGIRGARYSASGAYPIESGGINTITFYTDIDNDTIVERVRYFLNGSSLQRGIIKPSGLPPVYTGSEVISTVAQYVRNDATHVIFQYYDTAGALMSVPPVAINVRFVKIDLIVNVNPATMPNEFTLHSSATIRNVKNNL
ncbi:MAG: type II secretion system protein [Candidatus Parcubacteria bacterium]|nr:type II secretion system protein [Candidatus Parcubacteria bacterium]